MGFKSASCAGQDISSKDLLFIFPFNVPLAEFTCILGVIILHAYKSLSHKARSRWDQVMLQYTEIDNLNLFPLHLVQIPDFAIGKAPHAITEPPVCFTVAVTLKVAALSLTSI